MEDNHGGLPFPYPYRATLCANRGWSLGCCMGPRTVMLLHTGLRWSRRRHWSQAFGDRTLDEINNSRIFRLKQRTLPWYFKSRISPGRQIPVLMQHLAILHRVSMNNSSYAPELILRSAQLSQPFVVMLHRSQHYPGSASPWRRHNILVHVAKRAIELRIVDVLRACVSQTEPAYTRIGL